MLRPPGFLARCFRLVQPRDFVWLALFGVLIARPQNPDEPQEIVFLAALGVAQVLEPKIPAEPTTRSRLLWIGLKLALAFMLIGFSFGINSVYWPVLLLPVVSAATMFGVMGTTLCAAVAGAAYLLFLHWVKDPSEITADPVPPVVLLAMIANLANSVAEDLRSQTRKSRAAAEQLAAANAQLQQAEEEKRRADRLAALGQLSAGLAHELRNPLGTIRASSEVLTRSLAKENEVAREVAGFIASEVDRCNSLITRFLQFARPLQLQFAQADLAQTLDRAVALAEREAPGIAFYRNYQPDIPPFRFRCRAAGARFLQPTDQRRAGQPARRRRHAEDPRRRRQGGSLGDRPRLRHRSRPARQYFQSILHYQAAGRRPRAGYRFQNRRRTRR